ncbi:MAG: hypothetical protein ABMB14_28575, partial [Myxococcota bacterium]
MLWLLAVSTATAVPCALRATPLPDPGLSPELRAVAPQYFHASHRGGFDAYRGRGNVFPWFDLYDLRVGVRPPAMVRISASTDSWLVGMSVKAETPWPTLLLPRSGAGRRRIIGHERYPIEALERATGEVLVLARGSGQLYLLRVPPDPSAAVTELGLGLPDAAFDVRLGRTADDHPILAWLARDGDRLEVRASWSLDPADGIVVDAVTLSPAVAELSGRSRVELALAADGDHDLAIAWRPLADPDYPDVLPEVAY